MMKGGKMGYRKRVRKNVNPRSPLWTSKWTSKPIDNSLSIHVGKIDNNFRKRFMIDINIDDYFRIINGDFLWIKGYVDHEYIVERYIKTNDYQMKEEMLHFSKVEQFKMTRSTQIELIEKLFGV